MFQLPIFSRASHRFHKGVSLMGGFKLLGNWVETLQCKVTILLLSTRSYCLFTVFPQMATKQRPQSPSSAASSPDLPPWDFLRNLFLFFWMTMFFSFPPFTKTYNRSETQNDANMSANMMFMCWLCVRKTFYDLWQTSWALFMVFPALMMSSGWNVIMACISSRVA